MLIQAYFFHGERYLGRAAVGETVEVVRYDGSTFVRMPVHVEPISGRWPPVIFRAIAVEQVVEKLEL